MKNDEANNLCVGLLAELHMLCGNLKTGPITPDIMCQNLVKQERILEVLIDEMSREITKRLRDLSNKNMFFDKKE